MKVKDTNIMINMLAWVTEVVNSNALENTTLDFFLQELEKFLEYLVQMIQDCDPDRLKVIKSINFCFEPFANLKKGYAPHVENYVKNYKQMQDRLSNGGEKLELDLLLTFESTQGVVWPRETFRSLFSNRTTYDEGLIPKDSNMYKIKEQLAIKFIEGFMKRPAQALDMYKYIEQKFAKFKNYAKYYRSKGNYALTSDEIIHLANQYVESPMTLGIIEFLKDKIQRRLDMNDTTNSAFIDKNIIGQEWAEIDCDKMVSFEIQESESQNADDGDKKYWEIISDSGDQVDLTNFMFRTLIKKKPDDTFVVVLYSLLNKDYREYLQKFCKNNLANIDYLDKKLVNMRKVVLEEQKEEKKNRVHQKDKKASFVFIEKILNSTLLYDITAISKKGQSYVSLKDQIILPSSRRY